MTSTSPGGFVAVVDLTGATQLWVTDGSLGFCKITVAAGGTSQLTNCVKPPTAAPLLGQPAYDPIGYVYLPDYSASSRGIWRFSFDGVLFGPDTGFNLTAAVSKPTAVALGGDGNLYATVAASGSIVRITNPGGTTQTAATVANTTVKAAPHGLAFVGADPSTAQLWIGEKTSVSVIATPFTCTKVALCTPTVIQPGIVSPTSIVFDAVRNLVYVGVASGVYRIDAATQVADFYSAYWVKNGAPGLYFGVTGIGLDSLGNLYVIDDATLGLAAGAATMYQVAPGLAPDGSAPQPQPAPLPTPTVFSTASTNPGWLYSSGLTTPKVALWMGNHLWVLDHAHGFCKVDPTLAAPSLTACAVGAGAAPGQPAFDTAHNLLYIPDNTSLGAGINVFAFDPVLETLGAAKSVAKIGTLTAVAGTAPTALAFGGDGQLYIAMGATPKILRLTAPSAGVHVISAIGAMNNPGAANLAFNKGDLFDVATGTVAIMRNATLCPAAGSCTAQVLVAPLTPPVSVASDGTFTYIGDAKKVWKYDLVAGTLTNLADIGLSPNLVTTSFAGIGGIGVDPLGQVYAADQGPLWQISSIKPTITSLSPTQGAATTTQTVTITGTNFSPGMSVTACPAITAGGVTFVSANQITATLSIGTGPVGSCGISVVTAVGTSFPTNYTILSTPPALGTITPAAGFRGGSAPNNVSVTLTGTDMLGATLSAGPDITAFITTATATQIVANFAIPATAAVGPVNVTVTTPSGTSNAVAFIVAAPAPVLNSVNPTQGSAASPVAATFVGTGLIGATLNLPPGMTLAVAPIVAATSISANLVIDATVSAGPQNISVTTPGGTTGPVTFNVLPVLTSITPAQAKAGTATIITLTGASLASLNSINAGANITVTNVLATSNKITATFTTPNTATLGAQSTTVTTPGGISSAVTFTITAPTPIVTSMAPVTGVRGASVALTVTGSGLVGATLNLPAGLALSGPPTVAFDQITAPLAIADNAPLGAQSITVTTPGGTTTAVTFTVSAPTPVLTSMTPTQGSAAATVPVTFTGTGLVDATLNLPAGITLSGAPVVTVASISANLVISSTATGTTTNTVASISVNTPGGRSNVLSFTIAPRAMLSIATTRLGDFTQAQAGAAYTVTVSNAITASPTIGPVTVTETAPSGFTLVSMAGAGWTCAGNTCTRADALAGGTSYPAIAVTVNVSPTTLSPQVNALNVSGGNSLTASTTDSTVIIFLPPTLAAVTPAAGVIGTSVPVVFTGTNLTSATLSPAAGIAIAGVAVTASQITANFNIAATAALGPQNITVTTPGGITTAVAFTIIPPAPALASIAPASVVTGISQPLIITGVNLNGASLNLGTGITATGMVVTATKITATLVVAATAPLGPANITVATAGGLSNAATFTVVPTPAAGAALVKTDTTTQGTWKTVYGADGQAIANDVTNYPLYAQVAFTGQTPYTWLGTTADVRAPQRGAIAGRIASAWYNAASYSIDINLTDGLPHQVALYGLDWDGANARAQRIDVLDPATGLVLASSPMSAFTAGQYMVWNLSGHVTLRVTRTGWVNAVLSGLFFDGASAPPPALASVTPATGVTGAIVPVTFTGTNLTGASLNLGASITATSVVATANQITASLAIAANAPVGPQTISVSTPGGISAPVTFMVNPLTPTLASIAPAVFVAGTSVPVTFTGTNLTSATLNLGAGITATGVVVTNTQITAAFNIAATAPLGSQNITVTTPGGTSTAAALTIISPAPVLAGIAPASGVIGISQPVIITGVNLNGASLNLGTGITATGVVVTATKITATLVVAATAPLGPANITVTTLGGISNAVTFTVVSTSAAGAAFVKTDTTTQGTWKTVYGADGQAIANDVTNYPLYAQVAFTGQTPYTWLGATADVRAPQRGVITGRIASAWYNVSSYSIDINLTDGLPHQVALYCLDWDSANARAQRIDVLDPATGLVLASRTMSAFTPGQYVVWNLSGHVTLQVTRTAGLPAVVTGLFFDAALAPPPALASVTPATGVTGATMPVTFTGTNLTGASLNLGAGITANGVVATAGQITASLAIAANAPVGPQTISVSTPGGISGTVTFMVNPLTPTVATIAPAVGVIGTSVPVTFTGTSLTSATLTPGTGITATGVLVTDTQITATLNIAATAPLGPQNITVTTPGGATTAVFTINKPAPVLASIAPASGVIGISQPVIITGVNLTGATLNPGTGITATGVVVTATKITATLVVAATAPLGPANITVTTVGGISNAVTFTVVPTTAAAAALVKTDTTTQGTWKTVYGADGQAIANDVTNYPLYAQVAFTGQTPYTWLGTTADVRAPQRGVIAGRIASAWYNVSSYSIDINLTDGLPHQVALYCLDWDGANSRAQRIDVLDPATGLVLASSPMSAFSAGQYQVWNLSGHVTLRVTRTAGGPAVVSGLFFN